MKKFGYILTAQGPQTNRGIDRLGEIISRFHSSVKLDNGKSIFPLKAGRTSKEMDLNCGSKVTVTVEGKDEEAAVAAIQNYFVSCM